MRVLLAFDKFKHSMTAKEACQAAALGLDSVGAHLEFDHRPLTDGGEGFCEILVESLEGQLETIEVHDALGRKRSAVVGFVELSSLPAKASELLGLGSEGTLAVLEMAQASGIQGIAEELRDPWRASTRGTGEMIRYVAGRGVQGILLGVGGSATNDLGVGALQELGMNLAVGGQVEPDSSPYRWKGEEVSISRDSMLELPPMRIACDVSNPLLGSEGATAVYGPQKGLKPEDYDTLEHTVAMMAGALCQTFSKPDDFHMTAGAGAAGGIAFGMMTACEAILVPGFDLVSAWLDLESAVRGADRVITGEGRFDQSSLSGKGPAALIELAQRYGKPAYVFAGEVSQEVLARLPQNDILQLYSIARKEASLEESLREGVSRLTQVVSETFSNER